MTTKPPTIATVLATLAHRPALERALGTYAYTLRHVTGGSRMHAGAIQARDDVTNATPYDVDVSALIDAYLTREDRR